MEDPSSANDFDGPWKEALDQYFEAFLAFFFPAAHVEIDWFLHMPPAENRQILEELLESDQENTMRRMTGFEQLWLEEGMAKGRAEGRAEVRGAVEEAINILLRTKFGAAAEDLIPVVRRLADLDQLRAALRSIESAATVDDVRRALPQNGN